MLYAFTARHSLCLDLTSARTLKVYGPGRLGGGVLGSQLASHWRNRTGGWGPEPPTPTRAEGKSWLLLLNSGKPPLPASLENGNSVSASSAGSQEVLVSAS